MATQRDQHHAGWYSVQPYLYAQLSECPLAADLGYLSRSERVSSEPRERSSSDGEGQAVEWVYPVCQLLRASVAGHEERRRYPAKPLRQRKPEPGQDACVLHHRFCVEQELRYSVGGPQGAIPHRDV